MSRQRTPPLDRRQFLIRNASVATAATILPRHHADWLRACKGGPPASGEFEYASRLMEFLLLGNVALRARKRIRWDREAMRAINAPEADRFIRGAAYRAGRELPV